MFKHAITFIAILVYPVPALAAEQDIAITVCETILKSHLKAPSPYRQIDAKITQNVVVLTYDAVNSFNAPLRDIKFCEFNLESDGKFYLSGPDTRFMQEKFNTLKSQAENATSQHELARIRSEFIDAQREIAEMMAKTIHNYELLKTVDGYPIPEKLTSLSKNK